ncbi:5'-deoxynucleotidase [Dongshaea marina]|uniref:5'-deoxynucleotidase n=1 Tax=Dongshaea marina TaxID=2047966 RepID=UPI000D3E8FA8|nr:5'-deoxynucleotidase [Dongshaea marina]
MQTSHFFAYLARMKLINRWPLMRNTQIENVCEHSLQVAMVAHALATIHNLKLPDSRQLNPDKAVTLALFHDASEVLTGDLPTPVKYYNPKIRDEYKLIEKEAEQKLLELLPKELQASYRPLLDSSQQDESLARLVKTADTLCAYIKCLEERSAGNHEFEQARKRLEQKLDELQSPELDYFMKTFIPSFSLTLDDLSQPDE